MKSAHVSFLRTAGAIEIELSINGQRLIRTRSQESFVRELQIHGVQEIVIEDKFRTELPTSSKSLTAAAMIPFDEPMAAFKLIAACASIEEIAAQPVRERRAVPRAEKPMAFERASTRNFSFH